MGTALLLKWQLFVLALFFLVVLLVFGLQFTVMLGNKNKKVVPVLFLVEGGVLQELIKARKLTKADIQTLEQDEYSG
jgi:hypothetical protein